MSAYVQIEQVNAYCPECSWGQGTYQSTEEAQKAVEFHNKEEHEKENK